MDVANVIGAQRNVSQLQGTLRIGVDISDFTVLNPEQVYLEWVDCLERILPALFAHRHWICFFGTQLDEIDVHVWMREQDVGDYVARKQLAPLNIKFHLRQIGDGRSRMTVLLHDQASKNQCPAEQLNMRVVERGVIADQLLIHRTFDSRPKHRIQKVRGDEYGDDQDGERTDNPSGDARASSSARRRRLGCYVVCCSSGHFSLMFLSVQGSKIDTAVAPELAPIFTKRVLKSGRLTVTLTGTPARIYIIGFIGRTIASSIRLRSDLRCQRSKSILRAFSRSLMNIYCIRRPNPSLSTTVLISSLRAMLHQSRFEEPTVDQTPSMFAVLACSILPCQR